MLLYLLAWLIVGFGVPLVLDAAYG
ncbi:hypothetical protein SEA_CINDARADIX_35 [Mycobacterium phage Cindaradix]|uniref:Uncharacterized protein n=1 Tax=Mycobacterium phage Cindaradix TaxID=2041524 RepID=A0A2D1G8I7_9CAUD|nr:hypothetical protein KIY78_gp35 [Mycobacterium phage Cindaradix]ATN88109.1 hypothetical protein SEA_CINDARADIX_35 [Mycobacterium phage Cindaradix]